MPSNDITNKITVVGDSEIKSAKAISVMPLPTHVINREQELKQRMVQIVTDLSHGTFGVLNSKLEQIKSVILDVVSKQENDLEQGLLDLEQKQDEEVNEMIQIQNQNIENFKNEFTINRIGLLSVGDYNEDSGKIEFIYDDTRITDFTYDDTSGILTIEY